MLLFTELAVGFGYVEGKIYFQSAMAGKKLTVFL
jgi:hypothetical protein